MHNPVILASGEVKYPAKFAAHIISFAIEFFFPFLEHLNYPTDWLSVEA